MRDIPLFTTQCGVASLTLKEIPYTSSAYIKFQSTSDFDTFLSECIDFCRIAGAEHIYACGDKNLKKYPIYTSILGMTCSREQLQDTDAALFPVQEELLEQWRSIYNRKMKKIPCASYMTQQDAKELVKRREGYFIHKGDTLYGIGTASGDAIGVVISEMPGAGREVLLALNHAISGQTVNVEVASTNHKAMELYSSLGFKAVKEITCWHKII